MVTKVSSVYQVTLQKGDQQQAKDGGKKKPESQFKDIFTKLLMGSSEKTIGYR